MDDTAPEESREEESKQYDGKYRESSVKPDRKRKESKHTLPQHREILNIKVVHGCLKIEEDTEREIKGKL